MSALVVGVDAALEEAGAELTSGLTVAFELSKPNLKPTEIKNILFINLTYRKDENEHRKPKVNASSMPTQMFKYFTLLIKKYLE